MRKRTYFFSLLVSCLLSMSTMTMAQDADEQPTDTPPDVSNQATIVRGQSMTVGQISSIADLKSARNEAGQPVSLTDKTYTIGSFTKTTLTILPPNGATEDVITLDLNANK